MAQKMEMNHSMTEQSGYLYLVRNTVTRRAYVGATTKHPRTRLSAHKSQANGLMLADQQLYGRDSFRLEWFDRVRDLRQSELRLMLRLRASGATLYNMQMQGFQYRHRGTGRIVKPGDWLRSKCGTYRLNVEFVGADYVVARSTSGNPELLHEHPLSLVEYLL